MGFAVGSVAAKLLTDGIPSHYPCTNLDLDPEDWFAVYHPSSMKDMYLLHDEDFCLIMHIPKSLVEDLSFDLVGWYREYLETRHFFRWHYLQKHGLRYLPEPEAVPEEITPSALEPIGIEFEFSNSSEQPATEDDLPGLIPLSDSDDDDDDDDKQSPKPVPVPDPEENVNEPRHTSEFMEGSSSFPELNQLETKVLQILTDCQPYPGDDIPVDPTYKKGDTQFVISQQDFNLIEIYDHVKGTETYIHTYLFSVMEEFLPQQMVC